MSAVQGRLPAGVPGDMHPVEPALVVVSEDRPYYYAHRRITLYSDLSVKAELSE